jgi:hypothetical protein
MRADDARWRFASLLFAVTLSACAHGRHATDEEINILPASYKADILAAMHAYLSDPTGIRDSAISEPSVKTIGNDKRYVVCLRLNPKQNGTSYAGVKEMAAVFVAGRFDRFLETAHEQCDDASYTPFPELGKLAR